MKLGLWRTAFRLARRIDAHLEVPALTHTGRPFRPETLLGRAR
ncbi:hypothetical protein [Flindersiella endophytica]